MNTDLWKLKVQNHPDRSRRDVSGVSEKQN